MFFKVNQEIQRMWSFNDFGGWGEATKKRTRTREYIWLIFMFFLLKYMSKHHLQYINLPFFKELPQNPKVIGWWFQILFWIFFTWTDDSQLDACAYLSITKGMIHIYKSRQMVWNAFTTYFFDKSLGPIPRSVYGKKLYNNRRSKSIKIVFLWSKKAQDRFPSLSISISSHGLFVEMFIFPWCHHRKGSIFVAFQDQVLGLVLRRLAFPKRVKNLRACCF